MRATSLPPARTDRPALTVLFLALLASRPLPVLPFPSDRADVPALLREIRNEVASLERYPGEDFARGEFFLGEGDDDTNKTHAVGILVKDEAGGSRLTIVVSRLEPARENPRVKYTRDPRTIVCAFTAAGVEIVRSDYPAAELEKLLPAVLKAVLDKKALLKKSACFLFPGPPLEAAREFASTIPVAEGGTREAGGTVGTGSRGAGELEAIPERSRREDVPAPIFL